MLHGVEADGAQPHRIPDGGTDFFQTKVFEEPQDLDILAGTGLPHSCLEQPPEVNKLLGQLPAFERCCLCQGRSKFGPLRRSKSRPVGEGVAVFVGRLERSLRSPFRAAQA